jgi:diguanylate cyclase (GGDEF)-like protein
LVYLDYLTGLYNRRAFEKLLEQTLLQVARAGGSVGLVMIDGNGFKRINDVYGHEVGDKTICFLAEQLRRVIRHADVVARLGGDEFAVILFNPGEQGVYALAKRIREILAEAFQTVPRGVQEISVSIGGTFRVFGQDSHLDQKAMALELLKEADQALYHAKERKAVETTPFFLFERPDQE